MNRKARSLGAALLAVALLVGALPTTGITAAAPSPAVGTTLLAGTTLVTGAGSGVFPGGAVWGGVALSGGSFGQGVAVFGDGTARGDFQMILAGTNVLGVATKILVVGWVTGLIWARTWVGVLYYLLPIPLYVAALWWLEKAGWLGAKPGGSSGRPPGSVG